jgi:hypothetical protein
MTLYDALNALDKPLTFGDTQQIEAQNLVANWPSLIEAFRAADDDTRRRALQILCLTPFQFAYLRSLHNSLLDPTSEREPPR